MTMESSWFENVIKNVRNLFTLEKETNDTAIKDIRNLFILEKENKVIKGGILRNIRNTFEHEESYYKTVREGNIWRNNDIEYKSNGDGNKTQSVEEYLNKIKAYLKDIIITLMKYDTWRIQLTITFNFISSKDDNAEERVMHSKSDNTEIMINDEADETLEEPFKSLLYRYQNNLEKLMRVSKFAFDYVHLLYYKCHKKI